MKTIKNGDMTILFNIGNANHQTLNKYIYNGKLRPRSEYDRRTTTRYRKRRAKAILFTCNGQLITSIGMDVFNNGDLWDFYSNELPKMNRRNSERLERILKRFTETELFQMSFGFRMESDLQVINGAGTVGRPDLTTRNYQTLFLDWLNNESSYFNGMEDYLKTFHKSNNSSSIHEFNMSKIKGFSRLYIQPEEHGYGVKIPYGQVLHRCVKTNKHYRFWSFSKWSPIKFELIYKGNLGGFVSTEWLEKNSVVCPQCKESRTSDDMLSYKDAETEFDKSGIIYGRQSTVCKKCFQQNVYDMTRYSIRGHRQSDNPSLRFFRYDRKKDSTFSTPDETSSVFYGFELEVEKRATSDRERNHIAFDINKESDGFLFCKHDGSLNNGFEVVSQPATFNAIRKMDLNKMLFKHRTDVKGFHTATAGMHVHINRQSFTDLQLYKFVLMLNENVSLTKFISQRRNDREFEQWARLSNSMSQDVKSESAFRIKSMKEGTLTRPANKKYQADVKTGGTRYLAVNLQNDATIEVRIFKSNLDEVSFRKNIEFVDAVFWFCKESPATDLNVSKFLQFVKKNRQNYSNLLKFFTRITAVESLLN